MLFTVNSVLSNFTGNSDITVVMNRVIAGFVSVFAFVAYIIMIAGFINLNKTCKLNDDNPNYYMGKKLTTLTIACFLLGIVLSFAAIILNTLIAQYNTVETLTQQDEQARMNLMILTAIINICLQLFAVSTPFIFYLWKLRSIIDDKKLVNFALLTLIVMVVQTTIGILNASYIVKNSQSEFLTSFAEILFTIKFLLLSIFLYLYRNNIASKIPDEE